MDKNMRGFPLKSRKPTDVLHEAIYTASGKWKKPIGDVFRKGECTILVRVWGGGGSGGSARAASVSTCRVSGGAGGGYMEYTLDYDDVGATETVTIGAGGTGVSRGTNGATNGNDGGDSSFGTHCYATGGAGGLANNASTDQVGSAAGGPQVYADAAFRDIGFDLWYGSAGAAGTAGTSGGSGTVAAAAVFGGAGGGANDGTYGGNGGYSLYGGDGSNASPASADGDSPGGGSGAAAFDAGTVSSGNGGDGRVEIYIVRGRRPSILSLLV